MELQALTAIAPLLGWAVHGGLLTHRLSTARRDPLTGLHTRAGWTARAERTLRRRPASAAVLLVDLDHFKHLNDTYGHAGGDAALVATADRLRTWCGPHGTAGRLGGDEFVAVTPELPADGIAQLVSSLRRPVAHGGAVIPVAASVGLCRVADFPASTLTSVLAVADAAMYAAKGRRRRGSSPAPR
ncbi:GGDEF domain-containing protein [Streptomyces sp. NPDC048639]|uniref:GGDEF domain-containing protein n=1 Tax=Streptomyces sp. NPDC048639 TaxID=3365581 RepID=UPI003713F518